MVSSQTEHIALGPSWLAAIWMGDAPCTNLALVKPFFFSPMWIGSPGCLWPSTKSPGNCRPGTANSNTVSANHAIRLNALRQKVVFAELTNVRRVVEQPCAVNAKFDPDYCELSARPFSESELFALV
jgi:hypothetical protein